MDWIRNESLRKIVFYLIMCLSIVFGSEISDRVVESFV